MICCNFFLIFNHFSQWSISFILILIIGLTLYNLISLFNRLNMGDYRLNRSGTIFDSSKQLMYIIHCIHWTC
jgi:hypothetical protein